MDTPSSHLHPQLRRERQRWSISVLRLGRRLDLGRLPVPTVADLTAGDVSDLDAAFVADPFLAYSDGRWHLFMEVMCRRSGRGRIGLAVSADGLSWHYLGIVLEEPVHLSYPRVFRHRGCWYMIPETLDLDGIWLYTATDWPRCWERSARLVPGRYADPTILWASGRWWLFACPRPHEHDELAVFWSPRLQGTWHPHAGNPVVAGDRASSRPAGSMLTLSGRIIRFAQDCRAGYGHAVRAFVVDRLTPDDFSQHEHPRSPVLTTGGQGWNSDGMHHLDLHRTLGGWLAAVDGHYLEATGA